MKRWVNERIEFIRREMNETVVLARRNVLPVVAIPVPGLLAFAGVYAFRALECRHLLDKVVLEEVGLWLMASIVVTAGVSLLVLRNRMVGLLAALALMFLIRELDDTAFCLMGRTCTVQSKTLVSALLVGWIAWVLAWYRHVEEFLRDHLHRWSVTLVGWTYVFSQLAARRGFRHLLPDEGLLHGALEENAENVAHLAFLLMLMCLLVRAVMRMRNDRRATRNQGN